MVPGLLITSPTGQGEQTGNWHTASRYQQLLASQGVPSAIWVLDHSDDPAASFQAQRFQDLAGAPLRPAAALVLHAGRGARAADFLRALAFPVSVVVTGTDLYRDMQSSGPRQEACLKNLSNAARVICLQARAAEELARRFPGLAQQLRVVAQTVAPAEPSLQARPWGGAHAPLELLITGHIRPEKDPLTAFHGVLLAAQRLPGQQFRLRHVGGSLDADLAGKIDLLVAKHPALFQRLGKVSQDESRRAMAGAHFLVQPSLMEGGALVVSEACAAGLPVLASRVPGHEGLLGDSHPGFFEVADAGALADLLCRVVQEPALRQQISESMQRAAPALTEPALEAAQIAAVARHTLGLASATPIH